MICASLNLLFFTSVSFDDGLSLKPRDQEGGRSRPTVRDLRARGVDLKVYEGMGQDNHGIWG